MDGHSVTVDRCTFTRNRGNVSGGAIFSSTQLHVSASVFNGNAATAEDNPGMLTSGGAIAIPYTYDPPSAITNCTFTGNVADQGAAILTANENITNCTFASNVATQGIIYSGFSTIVNSIVWGNTTDPLFGNVTPYVEESDIQGGLFGAPSIINVDPLFTRAPSPGVDGSWGTSDDDYGDLRPSKSSPVIDAGATDLVPAEITTDLAGNSRLTDVLNVPDTGRGPFPVVDMGAFEAQTPSLPPIAKHGGPYSVFEGNVILVNGSASSDPDNLVVTYEWDFNYDGSTFQVDATGVTPTFSAALIDGPATRRIALRVRDVGGTVSAIASTTVSISNVAPGATFKNDGSVPLGSTAVVRFVNPNDTSPADVAAGFKYSYDFNNDGVFEITDSSSASATVPAQYLSTVGGHVVRGRIKDKDGGSAISTSTVQVTSSGTTSQKFTGTIIGTTGSYNNNGNTRDKAFDGNLATYFDAPVANKDNAWVGLDLGSAKVLTEVRFAPRTNYANRMVGGKFQASNAADFSSGVATLFTITTAPTGGVLTAKTFANTTAYRYVRYLAPIGSYGNIAEVQFWGPTTPQAPKLSGTVIGTTGSYNNNGNTRDKAFDGLTTTWFDAPVANKDNAWVGLDLGSARKITRIRFTPRPNYLARMVGGKFQASNSADFSSGVVDLLTITSTPVAGWNDVNINLAGTFRYVRYLGPAGSYGNVAEIEFYGN